MQVKYSRKKIPMFCHLLDITGVSGSRKNLALMGWRHTRVVVEWLLSLKEAREGV